MPFYYRRKDLLPRAFLLEHNAAVRYCSSFTQVGSAEREENHLRFRIIFFTNVVYALALQIAVAIDIMLSHYQTYSCEHSFSRAPEEISFKLEPSFTWTRG